MLIYIKNRDIDTEIDLPSCKSESNRALMIMHYAKSQSAIDNEKLEIAPFSHISNLSKSDDTILLEQLLNKINEQSMSYEMIELDCANAGTVFRFLMTAVANLQLTINNLQFTITDKDSDSQISRFSDSQILRFLITGSDRMKLRPISSLVDALRNLGVTIEYTERDGYPPVLIKVSKFGGQHPNYDSQFSTFNNKVEVSVSQSSQFASSLLLAAPTWKDGLELSLTGELSSLPYIDMTIDMMRRCGIDVKRNDRTIIVKSGIYKVDNIIIEPDWSAAAFWYEMAALSDSANISLKNLNINSLQADAVVMKIFDDLGVETFSSDGGVVIRRSQGRRVARSQGLKSIVNSQQLINFTGQQIFNCQFLTFNFMDCPDLFPAVIATCAGLKVNATFTGLKNLSIKESDRKIAMINELKKINISFDEISEDVIRMRCPETLPYFTEENPIIFKNYGDHRIAMALSILSLKIGAIEMENPEVVSKSYPGFFRDMKIKTGRT
ncbi:MAG: hypothetical protein IKM23_02670 [Bacteroidales bacterium]|nr:hypothetical protein [Bacteroidales bacterium]